MLLDESGAESLEGTTNKLWKWAAVICRLAYFLPALLWLFLVPGNTERPGAAAAGSCWVVNHGHHYQVDCARWQIADFCGKWLFAYTVVALLAYAVTAVGRWARRFLVS
jgi:hypothetical protein